MIFYNFLSCSHVSLFFLIAFCHSQSLTLCRGSFLQLCNFVVSVEWVSCIHLRIPGYQDPEWHRYLCWYKIWTVRGDCIGGCCRPVDWFCDLWCASWCNVPILDSEMSNLWSISTSQSINISQCRYDRYVLEIWYLDAIAVACCCWQRSLRYIAIIAQERGKGHGRRLVQHGPPPKSHKKRQFLRVNLYALRHFVHLNLHQLLDIRALCVAFHYVSYFHPVLCSFHFFPFLLWIHTDSLSMLPGPEGGSLRNRGSGRRCGDAHFCKFVAGVDICCPWPWSFQLASKPSRFAVAHRTHHDTSWHIMTHYEPHFCNWFGDLQLFMPISLRPR